MTSLEELLNKLIEKGRVPFGDEKIHSFEIIYVTGKIRNIVAKRGRGQVNEHYSIIELCSKSSGLWQFVCENGMVKHEVYEDIQSGEHTTAEHSDFWYTSGDNYEYRIIQSALCDEDKLEQFLLDNIKIGDI